MKISRGKNPHIGKQMAPTSAESYGDNYGVLQRMASGGEVDNTNILDKLEQIITGRTPPQGQIQPNAADLQRTIPDVEKYGSDYQKAKTQQGYADGGEVEGLHDRTERFSHLNDMMKKHKKANSQAIASKNPMKFIKNNQSMSLKGLKGVAG